MSHENTPENTPETTPETTQPALPTRAEALAALTLLRNALQPPVVQQLASNGTWESYAQVQQAHQVLVAYLD